MLSEIFAQIAIARNWLREVLQAKADESLNLRSHSTKSRADRHNVARLLLCPRFPQRLAGATNLHICRMYNFLRPLDVLARMDSARAHTCSHKT
jgi:hypothetical protein